MKPRIRWIPGQGWTILHMNVGFDDLSVAYDVAVGKRWMTPSSPRPTDMADALAYIITQDGTWIKGRSRS